MADDSAFASLSQGMSLFSGDPSSATPAAVKIPVPRNGRGWAYLHVLIAANASDTCAVAVSGRLNSGGGYVALNKQDHSTACSVAQSGGAATEVITTVELMPDMKVVLSGTRTSGASVKVWLEATGAASRADS